MKKPPGSRVRFDPRRIAPSGNWFETRLIVSRELPEKLMAQKHLRRRMQAISLQRLKSGRSSVLPIGAAVENALQLVPESKKQLLLGPKTKQRNEKQELTDVEKLRLIYSHPKAKAEFFRTLEHYTSEKTYWGRLSDHDSVVEKYFGNHPFTMADVGCSHGITTEETAERFPKAKVIGFDSFFPLGFSKKGKKADYREHDILVKPLPRKFDCIRFANVNPHLTTRGKALARRNLSASLKEGGLLIANDYEKKPWGEVKITRIYRKKGNRLFFQEAFRDSIGKDFDYFDY